MTTSHFITEKRIRTWAGNRSFERGQTYFEEGRVRALQERKGKIGASVQGTHNYRVNLWPYDDSVEYVCDCPVGRQGDFCKHCVATALAWLEKNTTGTGNTTRKQKKTKTELTLQDVRAWLLLQKKENLVDMLLDASSEDEQLHNQLMLKAAAGKHVNLATYRKILKQAINSGEFIDYYHMYDYYRGVESAIDAINELLDQDRGDAVIELSEYALSLLEEAIEHVDDSDGYMSMLLQHLQDLHLTACHNTNPDQETLAERLFQWELNSEWDIFYGAVATYSQVLGKDGIERYRELAEKEWRKIKPLQPGDDDRDRYGKRFRITHIMEDLAKQTGDIETLITIKQRDLSSSYRYLEIAEIYRKARQGNKALEWAEQGIQIFGKKSDSRLQDLLADMYHRRKHHNKAIELIWLQFEQRLTLDNYQKLKKHSDRNKSWHKWRRKALNHLRDTINAKRLQQSHKLPRHAYRMDHSQLVEIFLWEKDTESAWKEAQEGGCSERLWLRLAQLREKKYPHDAIAIYRKRVEPLVEQTNNTAYAEAVEMLRKIEKLMARLDERDAFQQYLDKLRIEYKRKRNFIKLLEKFK